MIAVKGKISAECIVKSMVKRGILGREWDAIYFAFGAKREPSSSSTLSSRRLFLSPVAQPDDGCCRDLDLLVFVVVSLLVKGDHHHHDDFKLKAQ